MRRTSPFKYSQPSRASKAVLARYSCAVACFATVALLAFCPRRTTFCSASVSMGRMASSAAHCPFAETKRTVCRCKRLGPRRVCSTSMRRTSTSYTPSPTKASARGDISRKSTLGAPGRRFSNSKSPLSLCKAAASFSPCSEHIVKLVFANADGVVLFHAQLQQLFQHAGIGKLALEILQALVVVHVAAGQNALQPGGLHLKLVLG